MKNRFDALMHDPSFIRRLVLAEHIEDAVRIFAEHGLKLTAGDLERFAAISRDAELSELELELAAGGSPSSANPYIVLTKLISRRNRSIGGN